MNKVILTSNNYNLTNTEFSYYYWSGYLYFINTYGSYLSGTGHHKPLDERICDGETAWQGLHGGSGAQHRGQHHGLLVQAAEARLCSG